MRDSATLHSVDFRFLLPFDRQGPFEHLVLVGGPSGMAERLVETNTAVAVSHCATAQRDADAIVVLGHQPSNLREVAASLQPAGVLFLQRRNAPLMLGRTRTDTLRRELATIGLELLATYATRPNSISPRVYIPLGATGPLLWYLRTFQFVTDPRSWLLNKALLGIANASPQLLASCLPDVAIVARKPVPGEALAHQSPSILAEPLLESVLGATDLHPLLISGQRTILFVFGRESSEPLAVIKIPKLASENHATENGHQALTDLKRQPDSLIASSVPQPVCLLNWRGISVAVESVVHGHTLARALDAWRSSLNAKVEGLQQAARWLSRFHRASLLTRTTWAAADTARWVIAPTEQYRQMLGQTDGERQLFTAAADYAGSVATLDLPIVRQHRDFRPVNVIRGDRGEISVVDWEGYRAGPAFCDLFHFVMQWHSGARRLDAQTKVKGFERLLFEPIDDPIGHVVHDVMVEYVNELRLSGGVIPLLILYMLVELATRRGEQQQREQGGSDLRLGNENIQFVGALAAHLDEFLNAPRVGSLLHRLRQANGADEIITRSKTPDQA
jgi:phosphotransferase family enzyme